MNIVLFSKEDKLAPSADTQQDKQEWVFYKGNERFLHIKKILKLKVGDNFKAGIINGKLGEAKILSFSDKELTFSFEERKKPLPLPKIKLILGFPRPIQLKRILRDIASLGCAEIFLCGTELGEASYLKSGLAEESQIRKYLLDGISQAGQSLLPEFSLYPSIEKALKEISSRQDKKNKDEADKQNEQDSQNKLHSKKILLDIDKNAKPLSNFKLKNQNEELILAIGSERGWTNNERKLFEQYNFTKASLGERILRTETATTSALAISLS